MAENNYDLEYTGSMVDRILDTGYDLQNQGYIFRGLASHYTGTPTERTWLIAPTGSTGFGLSSPVPPGSIGICMYNGTSWSAEVLNTLTLDTAPTTDSGNGITSGAVKTLAESITDAIAQLARSVSDRFTSLTLEDTTGSLQAELLSITLKYVFEGETESLTSISILAATAEKAGLMSAADKQKLDAFVTNIRSLRIQDTTAQADQGTEITNTLKWTIGGVTEAITAFTLYAATTSKAGLMSAADKTALDTLPSLINAGYLYAGIATPSNTPSNATAKVFYIATEAGIYTGFGNVNLSQGFNIIGYDGNVWSAVQVFGIDDDPVAGSDSLIRSKAVASLVNVTSDLAVLTPVSVVDGKYMYDDGERTSSALEYWKYSVSAGYNYLFSGKFSAMTNIKFIYWLNGDSVVGSEPYRGSNSEAVEYTDQMITAPANATHLCLNVESSQASLSKVKKLGDLLLSRELKDWILENKKYIDPVRGDMFVYKRAAIIPGGSIREDWTDGIGATDYLPITGYDDIVCENLWNNSAIVGVAFYDANRQFIEAGTGTQNSTRQTDYNISVEDIPDGAKYIRCSVNTLRSGPHTIVSGVNFSSLNRNMENLEGKTAGILEAITKYSFTPLQADVISGKLFGRTGIIVDNASYQINKYAVEGGKKYAFSGITVSGANLYYVSWWDNDGNFITVEPYQGSLTEATKYTNQVISAPGNAAYLYLNVLTSIQGEFNASYATPYYVSSSQLRDDVDALENRGAGNMQVTIRGNDVYVRTALDDTDDIIVKFSQAANGNMTPVETYMGSNTASDDTIIQNAIHTWSDSTAPFRAVPQFWHLFAQHGIPIPLAVVTDNPLTSSDEGSVWKDQSDRDYTIGKVSGNQIYLIPKVTATGTPGIVTRDWRDAVHDSYPTLLTHVSGGTYTSDITVTSCSQYQVRPMQVSSGRQFMCDGKAVGNGTYMCNEFVISETLTCLDPTMMTAYFPIPTSSQNAFTIVNSFIFRGLSIGFNQLVSCEHPFQFSYYGANQAQHLSDTNGMEAYVMIPKVKKVNGNGNVMSSFFRSQPTDADVTVYRTADDLYDVNKVPDRQLSVLMDDGTPVIGFASGVSLIRGITRDEVRNTYIANYNGSKGNALMFSPANRNKFYVGVVTGDNTEHFTNYLMEPDFCKEFSTYFTYFKPTDSVQTYWYNDGDTTVIYIHAESNTGRIFVEVGCCEGKTLEVVEKTSNATLLSDSITNGKVCVDFSSNDANYIVLKTK